MASAAFLASDKIFLTDSSASAIILSIIILPSFIGVSSFSSINYNWMLLIIRNETRSARTAYVSTIAAKSIPFESSLGFLPTSMIPEAAALP